MGRESYLFINWATYRISGQRKSIISGHFTPFDRPNSFFMTVFWKRCWKTAKVADVYTTRLSTRVLDRDA